MASCAFADPKRKKAPGTSRFAPRTLDVRNASLDVRAARST
jgi:hypothetical protein